MMTTRPYLLSTAVICVSIPALGGCPKETPSTTSSTAPSTAQSTAPSPQLAQGEDLVILQVIVDESGHVESVEVIEGNPPFVAEAAKTVQKWRYKPYVVNGKPVRYRQKVK